MKRKGIILAGGAGTRLHPITKVISKQLLPIYNKPMVYYPLTTLMRAGITEFLVISAPDQLPFFKTLLGDGSQWQIAIDYAEQQSPKGIAEALIIADKWLNHQPSALILGDNLFHGEDLCLAKASKDFGFAHIFTYQVKDPERYGVYSPHTRYIVEKPTTHLSNEAVVGVYFYPPGAPEIAAQILPSKRGEIEITCLNNYYLEQKNMLVHALPRGTAWLDTGTHDSLLEASHFVQTIENRTGLPIGSPDHEAKRLQEI